MPQTATPLRMRYVKHEHMVPMRDGTRLHTTVYVPRTCVDAGAPIMLTRTPYGVAPYGADAYRNNLGPSNRFEEAGFIFVYQDVRGRFLSEGIWEEVRPHVPAAQLQPGQATESSDAYDTIEWLLQHVPCHNGRVGMWGISYPGFYASSGMVEAHPALRAVSPQGPVTDYFLNDDSFHNGAFLLAHNFGFYVNFFPRGPTPAPPRSDRATFDFGTDDHYAFYLGLGRSAPPRDDMDSTRTRTGWPISSTRRMTPTGRREASGGISTTLRLQCSRSAAGTTPRTSMARCARTRRCATRARQPRQCS